MLKEWDQELTVCLNTSRIKNNQEMALVVSVLVDYQLANYSVHQSGEIEFRMQKDQNLPAILQGIRQVGLEIRKVGVK